MGATGSVACSEHVSAEEVGTFVENLGVAYKPYKAMIIENGVDGKVLKSMKASELKDLLSEIGIEKALHVRVLMSHLKDICSSSASEAPQPVETTSSVPFKEHDVVVNEACTMTPRTIMSKLFEIQGIPLDPTDVESAVRTIKDVVGTGYGDGVSKYDCFINYRVASDADVALKLYLFLKIAGVHAFLDKKCLKNGQKWKDGFLTGLKRSNYFVAIISKSGLARVRDTAQDHASDNVLLEYETAIKIMNDTGNPKFICPIHCGENNYIPALAETVLCKFKDFAPHLYPDSIGPIKAEAPPAAPPSTQKAKKANGKRPPAPPSDDGSAEGDEEEEEEEAEGEEGGDAPECDYVVDGEEIDVCCQNCMESKITGPKAPFSEEMIEQCGDSWGCDWPTHEGPEEMSMRNDKIYGCDTIIDCNWAICEVCFNKLKAARSNMTNSGVIMRDQPQGTSSKLISNEEYFVSFPQVSISPVDPDNHDGEWALFVLFSAHGDGSENDGADLDLGDPIQIRLVLEGEEPRYCTNSTIFSKDGYQVTGRLEFRADHFTKDFLQAATASMSLGDDETMDSYTTALLAIPGSTVDVDFVVPECCGEHQMVVSGYAEDGYEWGYVCSNCQNQYNDERWFCKECQDDYCFNCVAAPIINPECSAGHKCERHITGSIPKKYSDMGPGFGAQCDECSADGLHQKAEYYHCPECCYDLCLSCAYGKHVIKLS
jgi:hypothetical protein